jgi:hypothetical protein
VIRCLQEHRRSLSGTCAAALFDHEVGVVRGFGGGGGRGGCEHAGSVSMHRSVP